MARRSLPIFDIKIQDNHFTGQPNVLLVLRLVILTDSKGVKGTILEDMILNRNIPPAVLTGRAEG